MTTATPTQTRAMQHDRHLYRITGGQPLHGTVTVGGAKNAVTKQLVASLLTTEPSVLTNVPRILEVEIVLHMLEELGTRVDWLDDRSLRVETPEITNASLSELYSDVNRIPILMMGPLLHRVGESNIPLPGGCRIGNDPSTSTSPDSGKWARKSARCRAA